MKATADGADERILILAPIGRDAQASAELLRRAGVETAIEICADLPALVAGISAGAGTVFVAEEALFGQDLSALKAWIDGQPPWSDLPFIVLTSRHDRPRVAAWRQQLVDILRNVAMIERPVQPITLSSTVQAAIRARRRQREVRALLEARERAAAELESQVAEATRELREQMAERVQIQDSLRQAQKMEAIGQLTGGVAHDFNNLLMVISGALELIVKNRHSNRFDRLVEGMRHAAGRGASLTRQLLAFARRQPLEPVALDLAAQLGGMREMLDRSLRGDIDLEMHFPAGLWPVEVDPGELELVILNLAVNARDAMPAGGVITVSAENAAGPHANGLVGDFVRLTVADTGTGMAPEVQARVFEPFYTTKEIGKGSGLGLAQAYGFARGSGGTIDIESEVGAGSRITLLLPRSRAVIPAIPDRDAATGAAGGQTPRIGRVLLVEDDDEVATLVGEMLDELGYEVTRSASANGALGALANGRPIDVVFSDIMMPGGMDGVGLAREIRARQPQLPVVLTSGYPEAFCGQVEAEGLRILPKPFALADLEAVLAQALQGRAA